MKLKQLLAIMLGCIIFSSCNNRPHNVRELMESEGWEYCQMVEADAVFDEMPNQEKIIYELPGHYDLFRRNEDYALTRHDTDNISLDGYDSDDEHLKASCWINFRATAGDYSVTAQHARQGSGKLGVITKRYNGKCFRNSGDKSVVYFVFNSPKDASSSDYSDGHADEGAPEDVIEEDSEPQKKYKQCPACYGTSRCGACGGSGSVYNSIDYSPGQWVDCSSCGGSGSCGLCDGTGVVEDFGW